MWNPKPLVLTLLVLSTLSAVKGAVPRYYDRRDLQSANTEIIQVADVNGDGIPDIIGGNETDRIQVFFGRSDGTFAPGPITTPPVAAFTNLISGDFNGDGVVDIALAAGLDGDPEPQGIQFLFGSKSGTFTAGSFYVAATEKAARNLVSGDFNNDGILDFALQGELGVWTYLGTGEGALAAPTLTPISGDPLFALQAGDLNGDGNLDLVSDNDVGFYILLGNGNGTFETPQEIKTSFLPSSFAVADVNQDGRLDVVVVSNGLSESYIYFGKGNGTFTSPVPVALPGGTAIAVGDLNGDGIPDLADNLGYVAFGKGKGAFTQSAYFPTSQSGDFIGYNVLIAPLRPEGPPDILASSGGVVSVLLNNGKGTFEDGVSTTDPVAGSCGFISDVNHDGKPDLVLQNVNSTVTVLFGTGKEAAPFTIGPASDLASNNCGAGGDLNGDGYPDLLLPVANGQTANAGQLFTYFGNADGTFTVGPSTVQLSQLGNVALADFNGDGILDYAMSTNELAFGNGDGSFGTPAPFFRPIAGIGGQIIVGDLNGDGLPDIVIINENSTIFFLLNDGDGMFRQAMIGSERLPDIPDYATIGDVNGDGYPDVVCGGADGGVMIFLNNGKGELTYSAVLEPGVLGSSVPIIADVNGDSIPDILAEEMFEEVVYFGEGGGTFSKPLYLGLGSDAGYPLIGNMHGQSPSAGTPDIVVPNIYGPVLTILNETK